MHIRSCVFDRDSIFYKDSNKITANINSSPLIVKGQKNMNDFTELMYSDLLLCGKRKEENSECQTDVKISVGDFCLKDQDNVINTHSLFLSWKKHYFKSTAVSWNKKCGNLNQYYREKTKEASDWEPERVCASYCSGLSSGLAPSFSLDDLMCFSIFSSSSDWALWKYVIHARNYLPAPGAPLTDALGNLWRIMNPFSLKWDEGRVRPLVKSTKLLLGSLKVNNLLKWMKLRKL